MILDMTTTLRWTLLAAPLALVGYGTARIIGRLDDTYGPGLDWQLAHLFGLAGFVLFVPLVLGMRALLRGGPVRELAVGATLLGLAACVVQFAADMVEAFMAADSDELRSLQQDFSDLPGVQLAIYDVGPLFFFVGFVAVAVLAVRAGRLPWWSPVVLLLAFLLPVVGSLNLLPLTGLLMLAALLPLWRSLRDGAPPHATPGARSGV